VGLSVEASAFLNTLLMEAADRVQIGDGYINVLDAENACEIRAQLQAWRDSLSTPLLSRELVAEAFAALADSPRLEDLAAKHPNDAELGAAVREFALTAAHGAARARALLQEALDA
jgi:hypothetical protein